MSEYLLSQWLERWLTLVGPTGPRLVSRLDLTPSTLARVVRAGCRKPATGLDTSRGRDWPRSAASRSRSPGTSTRDRSISVRGVDSAWTGPVEASMSRQPVDDEIRSLGSGHVVLRRRGPKMRRQPIRRNAELDNSDISG